MDMGHPGERRERRGAQTRVLIVEVLRGSVLGVMGKASLCHPVTDCH